MATTTEEGRATVATATGEEKAMVVAKAGMAVVMARAGMVVVLAGRAVVVVEAQREVSLTVARAIRIARSSPSTAWSVRTTTVRHSLSSVRN